MKECLGLFQYFYSWFTPCFDSLEDNWRELKSLKWVFYLSPLKCSIEIQIVWNICQNGCWLRWSVWLDGTFTHIIILYLLMDHVNNDCLLAKSIYIIIHVYMEEDIYRRKHSISKTGKRSLKLILLNGINRTNSSINTNVV